MDHARGTPGNRLSDEELADKFHGLVDDVLGRERAERLAAAVFSLKASGDIGALLALTMPEAHR